MIIFLLAAACFFVIAWRNLVLGAAAILFLLPVYLLRFTVLGVPATLLELFVLILALVWIVRRVQHGGYPLLRIPWLWAILLFVLSAVIAIYVSPDRTSALGYFKAYFVEPILFFLVLWDTVKEERHVRWLLTAIGTSALLLSLVALEQYVGLLPSLQPWISQTPKRVVSLFEYPNALGLFVAPLIALFGAFVLLPKPHEARSRAAWFPWGVILFGCLSLLFAASRGGIIAVGAAAIFFGLLSPYRRWIFGILGAGLLVLLVLPQTRTILFGIVTGSDVSTDVRYVLWQGTANLLRARPIVGAGLGGFPILYNHFRLIKHTELLLYPHNIVLNFWVELGLAGLLLFCWILIDAWRRALRLLRNELTPFAQQLIYGVLAALLVIVVHGIVDVPYFKNDLAIEFWFFLALLPIAGRLRVSGQNR